MKDLRDFLNESLVNESKQIPITAYKLEDLVKLATKFNPSDKNADWDTWSTEFGIVDKTLIKKLCKICSNIAKKCDYGTIFIDNFYGDSYSEVLQQEFDAEPGDVYYFLSAVGDRGRLFYIKDPGTRSEQQDIKTLTTLVVGDGKVDWDIVTAY